MTIIHSSDLGWKAGQDISQEFAALAKTFKAGDTFVFDHMYKISGSDINLPDNFTLAGGAPGAGINITDSATNPHSLIELGGNNTLIDLTVTHSNVPDNDYVNKISIAVNGNDNIKVINSHFEGNVGIFLEVRHSDNLLIQDTEFDGGNYQVRVTSAKNMTVENSLFQNSFGDGIKTAATDGHPVQDSTISNSVFLNNRRDGLDTTGGFKDSVVQDSYFVGNNVSGLDIKTIYDGSDDLTNAVKNDNILITGTEFINSNSAIVVTTLDRGTPKYLDSGNALKYAAQGVTVENSTVINTGSTNSKFLLVKDAHDVHWNNVSLLGKLHELRADNNLDIGLPKDISGNSTTGDAPASLPDNYYRDMAGPDWSSLSYPAGGTPTSTDNDPVIAPDPISYEPTPDPDPTPEVSDPAPQPEIVVVETPITDNTSSPTQNPPTVNFASKFLDVFLAYTDTDKNVTQLSEGASIDGNLTDGQKLTIYATSQSDAPAIGSVKISVPGFGSRLENVEPFALFGDDGKGDFFGGKVLPDGTYTVTMTAFEGAKGTGAVLETVTFDFIVTDGNEVAVSPTPDAEPIVVIPVLPPETDLDRDSPALSDDINLLNVSLIDTGTDTVITNLFNGMKLSESDLENRNITISAEALNGVSDIGSVKLDLNDTYSRLENVAPYALFGDNGKGNFFGGLELSEGTHTATLTAYSGKKGNGSVLEEVTLNFQVGDYDSVLVDGKASTVSSYSKTQDKGSASFSEDSSLSDLKIAVGNPYLFTKKLQS